MGSSHLINHYQTNDELGRLSRQSQSIEFITTIRVLDEMLPKGCAVLDLGSGPGRYALHFAQQGHMVTAVDPVPKHIEQLHAQADRGDCSGRIRAFLGDHGTLDQWKPESYDAVLCMGPIG